MAQAVDFFPIVSDSLSSGSAIMSGLAQGKAKNAQGKAQEAALNQQAKLAMAQASKQEDQMRSSARQAIGKQLAAGAQNGVALSGSRLDMLHESYRNEEADAAHIRNEGLDAYKGFKTQAVQARAQGKRALAASKVKAFFDTANAVSTFSNNFETLKTKKEARAKQAQAENDKLNTDNTLNSKPKTSNSASPILGVSSDAVWRKPPQLYGAATTLKGRKRYGK